MKIRWRHVFHLLIASSLTASAGSFVSGREVSETRDVKLRGIVGTVSEMSGFVQETTRAFYDASDQQFKQDLAERFDFNDFNVDGGYATVGVGWERIWKYFTLQIDLLFMNPETDAVARRNYYIDVDDVSFNGRSFGNIKIPEGTPFSVDIFATLTEVNALYTPFTFKPSDSFQFTPWIGLGLFLFLGQYDIDAGPATGVTQYQFPLEDFVVGGSAEGYLGAGLPELGIGGEVVLGDTSGKDSARLSLQGHVGVLQYDGGTGYFTTSDHREKDVDIDHVHSWVQVALEIPLKSGRTMSFGGKYDVISSDAEITSEPGTIEEIIARRERFDKQIEFEMTTATGFVGITF
jgi:hypothetical protein